MLNLILLSLIGSAYADTPINPGSIRLNEHEKQISLLATNDIHGGIEAEEVKGHLVGGMDFFAGVVKAIRTGVSQNGEDRAGTVLLDAGDQFQGTLISNYDEGQTVYSLMNAIGYDAAVPGNHAYDFGPIGWLEDRVRDSSPDSDNKGAFLRLIRQSQFPLLSANTYLKESIQDASGKKIEVDSSSCAPLLGHPKIDWSHAARPQYFSAVIIKRVAGVRVAIIGLDNPRTSRITTAENVSDLCFRDSVETYLEVREQIKNKADIFVLVIHDGDSRQETNMIDQVEQINQNGNLVDAVIAGHTHYRENRKIGDVPLIQSGANGKAYGRIDLIWDTKKHRVITTKTRSFGGIPLFHDRCPREMVGICEEKEGTLYYEGQPVARDEKTTEILKKARQSIQKISEEKLGTSSEVIRTHRTEESALANYLTDTLKNLAQSEIAFLNTGGIRAPLPAGDFTYENLFRVLPMNNHAVKVGPLSVQALIALLKQSIQTCGSYGALMQSGLKVQYKRNCLKTRGGVDHRAELVQVETLAGEILYAHSAIVDEKKSFQVATIDFLMAGGSSYQSFQGVPLLSEMGVLREEMASYLRKNPVSLSNKTDGRWENMNKE